MKYPFDNPFRTYLDHLLEDQRRFDELISSSRRLAEFGTATDKLVTAAQFARKIQAFSLNVKAARFILPDLGAGSLNAKVSRLSNELESGLRAGEAFASSFKTLWQLDRQRLGDLLLGRDHLQEIARRQQDLIESAFAPARQLESALASIEAAARLYAAPEAHWANSLAIIESYERFAVHQSKAGSADQPMIAQRRARVTELAGGLLATSVAAADLGAELASEEAAEVRSEITSLKPQIYGPLNQHLGFVYRVDLAVDVDLAVGAAVPTQICELGTTLIALVVRINHRAQLAGRETVFRVTSRCLEASCLIPTYVTGSELTFGQVIDALYFLLYEGAGGRNCRLLTFVPDDVLEPLWRLKHLRLHYSHDIEHGDDREIKRKYATIGSAFRSLIDVDLPRRPREWTIAQVRLYTQLVEMLARVENALSADP